VSAQTLRPRRPATAAVVLATSAVSAPRKVVPAWEVLVAVRSATSAASGVTLPVTAPRVEATVASRVASRVASAEAVEDTVVVRVEATAVPARPLATLAVVSVT
jgi:hypothetical protein